MTEESKPADYVFELWNNPDVSNYLSYYSVGTYCKNCGKSGSVYIRKGIPKATIGSIKCQNCECLIKL